MIDVKYYFKTNNNILELWYKDVFATNPKASNFSKIEHCRRMLSNLLKQELNITDPLIYDYLKEEHDFPIIERGSSYEIFHDYMIKVPSINYFDHSSKEKLDLLLDFF